jgi:hypothetical protein
MGGSVCKIFLIQGLKLSRKETARRSNAWKCQKMEQERFVEFDGNISRFPVLRPWLYGATFGCVSSTID